jgi:hypothetical protein
MQEIVATAGGGDTLNILGVKVWENRSGSTRY